MHSSILHNLRPIQRALVAAIGLAIASCRPLPDAQESAITIRWELLELVDEQPRSYRSKLTITNEGNVTVDFRDWALYFNAPQPIASGAEHVAGQLYRWTAPLGTTLAPYRSLDIELRGRRWPVRITDAPSGFYSTVGDRRRVMDQVEILIPADRLRVDSMDNWVPSAASRFAANERLLSSGEDPELVLPTPVEITLQPDREPFRIDASTLIRHDGELATEAEYLAQALGALLSGDPLRTSERQDPGRAIVLRLASADSETLEQTEGYILSVLPTGVEIASRTTAGVFYGIQSLRALIAPSDYRGNVDALLVPSTLVRDWPRFGYRGLMLDVSRNFQSKASVEKLFELMAYYKLNRFHFHLTDDEGWRFEVQGLAELTSVGARRGHTLDESDRLIPSFGSGPDPDQAPGTGHYSREQFVELLKFAHRRHIEVIPEIDVPGHARAAIRAMEARRTRLLEEGDEEAAAAYLLSDPRDASEYTSVQNWDDNVINVCQESSYRFLQKVFDELAAIYRQAEAPLTTIHIGGDEVPPGVWERSLACESLMSNDSDAPQGTDQLAGYFLTRVHTMLDDMGLTTAGWEEIGFEHEGRKRPNLELADKQMRVHAWSDIWGRGGEDNAFMLANAGFQVVLSNASSLYFDLAANADPEEPGLYWAGLVDAERVWSFVPYDVLRTDTLDGFGRAINKNDPADALIELDESAVGNVLGIQGQIWGETTISQKRLEHMAFPKLLSLAERAWTAQPSWARIADAETRQSVKESAWSAFARRLGHRELPRLDFLEGGVDYRIPVPGVRVIRGVLHANVAFPGLTLRYSLDGTAPDAQSPVYEGPVALEPSAGVVLVTAFDRRGRASRPAVVE